MAAGRRMGAVSPDYRLMRRICENGQKVICSMWLESDCGRNIKQAGCSFNPLLNTVTGRQEFIIAQIFHQLVCA